MTRSFLSTIAFVAALSTAAPAAIHFEVSKSSPSNNQTVTESPKKIQLWFSQVPVEAVSQLKLTGADKADVALGKVVADKASKSLAVDVTAPLKPGAYVVSWKSAGDDGHVQNGEIKFTFKPKG